MSHYYFTSGSIQRPDVYITNPGIQEPYSCVLRLRGNLLKVAKHKVSKTDTVVETKARNEGQGHQSGRAEEDATPWSPHAQEFQHGAE